MVDFVIVHGGNDVLEGLAVSKWKSRDLTPDTTWVQPVTTALSYLSSLCSDSDQEALTALCVFSNPCPFCTSCFCLGVHFPNSYPVLQELLEIPHWNTMVFPPRVWARPQDNMFLPQAVEQVMEDRVPGTVTDLARACGHHGLASRNTLEPVRISSLLEQL